MRSPSCPSQCPRRSAARRPAAPRRPSAGEKGFQCMCTGDGRVASPATLRHPPLAAASRKSRSTTRCRRGAGIKRSAIEPEGDRRTKAPPAAPEPPVCPNLSSRHCGQRELPIANRTGAAQCRAWPPRAGLGARRGSAAPAASTSCTPSRARRLSAARAPRARCRAAAPSPFRRTTAESLARLSLRRAAAVALLLVWSTPSRGRRSVELVDANKLGQRWREK